jgi:hypothetical protein
VFELPRLRGLTGYTLLGDGPLLVVTAVAAGSALLLRWRPIGAGRP